MRNVLYVFRQFLGVAVLLVAVGLSLAAYVDGFGWKVSVGLLVGGCLFAYALYPIGQAYCPACDGTGTVDGGTQDQKEECPRCEGSGKVPMQKGGEN